jgi:hypothetical protein
MATTTYACGAAYDERRTTAPKSKCQNVTSVRTFGLIHQRPRRNSGRPATRPANQSVTAEGIGGRQSHLEAAEHNVPHTACILWRFSAAGCGVRDISILKN